MSDLKLSVLCRLYLSELHKARKDKPVVSAGELARRMGVSRGTAKRYLDVLVRHGKVLEYDFQHINGMTATAYIPNRVDQK